MRAAHEAALICDFAEYYHVYDFDTLPVQTAAILACGLPSDSRTVKEISGHQYDTKEMLLAAIYDQLSWILWQRMVSKNHKPKKPESLLKKMTSGTPASVTAFETPEDFERAFRHAMEA